MLGSARATGPRLGRNYHGKVKLINFTVLPAPYYNWAVMWGAQYNAARNLQWLQTARACGFNSVRIFCSNTPFDGPTDGVNSWPDLTTMRARATEFAAQCRSNNLLLLVSLSGSAKCPFGSNGLQASSIIPGIVAYAKIWREVAGDILLYFDAINEMNIDGPSTWSGSSYTGTTSATVISDMFDYFSALREQTKDIPLAVSTSHNGQVNAGSQWNDLQYDLSCAFHDVHNYVDNPTAASFASFEGRTKFLGKYIVSEFGANASMDNAQTIARLRPMGDIAARRRCMGIGMWAITPQDTAPGNDWGLCSDVAGTIVRSLKLAETSTYPASI